MKRQLSSIYASLVLGLTLAACGGQTGNLPLTIHVSPGDDPFAHDAAEVRFTIGTGTPTTVAVTQGHFKYNVSVNPNNNLQAITVEAIDANGNVIARGKTAPVALQTIEDDNTGVWVGRLGTFAVADTTLPTARAEFATIAVPGVGIVYAGGRDASGAVLNEAPLFSTLLQTMFIQVPALNTARAGAVGGPLTNGEGFIFGGSTAVGFGATATPVNSVELFSLNSLGVGQWSPVAAGATPVDARTLPALSITGNSAVMTGGLDLNGGPLQSSLQVSLSGAGTPSPVGSMAAPRFRHAQTNAHFATGGDGLLLFGGLPDNSTLPVAETLTGQTFGPYPDLNSLGNRRGATATTTSSGDVLILGGEDATGALASGFAATVSVMPAKITQISAALSVARVGHTATLLASGDILVCGGANATGTLQASCDLLDGASYGIKQTLPLAAARRDHSAATLDNGIVIIAGGFGSDGAPLKSIEIYTPN